MSERTVATQLPKLPWYTRLTRRFTDLQPARKALILLGFLIPAIVLPIPIRNPCLDEGAKVVHQTPGTPRTQPPETLSEASKRSGQGIVQLQFAGDRQKVEELRAAWSVTCDNRLADARGSVLLDYIYILVYVVGGVLFILAVQAATTFKIARWLGFAVIIALLIAGIADAMENWLSLVMIAGSYADWVPRVTRLLASTKFALAGITLAYILVVGFLNGWREVSESPRERDYQFSDADERRIRTSEFSQVPIAAEDLIGGLKPTDTQPDENGRLPHKAAHLEDVIAAELAYIAHHRPKKSHRGDDDPRIGRSLVGLALSGGGIRSATTNLGILQGLADLRVLPFVDYLSTVSGGGYIGACFSTLLSLTSSAVAHVEPGETDQDAHHFASGDTPAFSTLKAQFPLGDDRERQIGRTSTDLIAHLRTHGNFLIARRGLVKRDTLRAIGNIITGVVYNVTGFALILFAAAAVYLTTVNQVAPATGDMHPQMMDEPSHELPRFSPPEPYVATSAIVKTQRSACSPDEPQCTQVATHSIVNPGLDRWLLQNLWAVAEPIQALFQNAAPEHQFRKEDITTIVIVALVTGLLFSVFAWLTIKWPYLFLPDGVTLINGESYEEASDKAHLWMLAIRLGAWIAGLTVGLRLILPSDQTHLTLLWVPTSVLLGARISSIAVVLVATQSRTWDRQKRTLWGGYQAITIYGLWLSAGFLLLAPLIYAFAGNRLEVSLAGLFSLAVARLATPSRASGTNRRLQIPKGLQHFVLGLAVVCTIVFGLIVAGALLVTIDTTRANLGLTSFAAVIAIAFIGYVVDQNKLGLHYFYRDRLAETYLFSELPDREHRLWTFRDAMEMPLSELHGNFERKWKSETPPRNPAPYHLITAAINLAGSRDLTRKDRKSGYFLFSKLYCGSTHTGFRPTAIYRKGETKLARAIAISGAAVSSATGFQTFFAQAFATVLFNVRLGYWLENPAWAMSQYGSEGYVFWPEYLAREVTMTTNENTRLVNLSDGGHTGDNVGIYPLLQRRCKVIIACDAEADDSMTFGSFTEALRHAYIDMGISVDIDLSMIRPDPVSGRSRNHCAVGRILYPDRPLQASYLIYMKNSLTGDEPEPVLNYRATCPDFPHETTLDQFFDDAQFESYRALGVHMAKASFADWAGSLAFVVPEWAHTPDDAEVGR